MERCNLQRRIPFLSHQLSPCESLATTWPSGEFLCRYGMSHSPSTGATVWGSTSRDRTISRVQLGVNVTPQSCVYSSLGCLYIGCCPQRVDSFTPHQAVWDSLLVSLQVYYWLRVVKGVSKKLTHYGHIKGSSCLEMLSAIETEKRGSNKSYTATRIKCAIVLKCDALNWRALFSSYNVYLWDLKVADADNRNTRISRNTLDADALRRNLLHPDSLPLIAAQHIALLWNQPNPNGERITNYKETPVFPNTFIHFPRKLEDANRTPAYLARYVSCEFDSSLVATRLRGGRDPLSCALSRPQGHVKEEGDVSSACDIRLRSGVFPAYRGPSSHDPWRTPAQPPRCPRPHQDRKYKKLNTMSAYARQKAKSKYRNRIRLERASQKQSSDAHKTPFDRVRRFRERSHPLESLLKGGVNSPPPPRQLARAVCSPQLAPCTRATDCLLR
ncbi:hypothetical protein PR048_025340 [Dryococelus australis]|uniref:Uncharacterized protein n=1 Tax=Dryococelus australis TaxID=614101 RepID=A0ABQ9GQZ8_9NEOP|nr:hypothetical protein PR048_025340 [Dryococelus australis]